MTTATDINQLPYNFATKAAAEWFDARIQQFEHAAEEFRRRKENFLEAGTDPNTIGTPMDHLSWAVNDLTKVTMNFRADSAVHIAAELAVTRSRVR
jgi:hypothetical protein